MNTDNLVQILNEYLQILQETDAENEKINQVKMMIWAIEDDRKLQIFLNNLTISNDYYLLRVLQAAPCIS